jgi:orotate phosphoribosyltransferase
MVNKLARDLIAHRAIEFGSFVLASGVHSNYYIDIKSAATKPSLLTKIAKNITKIYDFDVVAGIAVGGVPIAVAVSLESGKPYAIIRRTEKDHGKTNLVIGDVKGKSVLLVEDVTTSGSSVLYGIKALRAAGANIDSVVTIVDREQGASEMLEKQGIHLLALVTAHELMQG